MKVALPISIKKIPKEELERIKSAIRADLKMERMKVWVLTSLVTFLILASFFAYIMFRFTQ